MIRTATPCRERERGARACTDPERERRDRDRNHDRHEHSRDAIREALSGSLSGLRLGYEPSDLGESSIRADLGGPDDETSTGVHGGTNHSVARRDLDRHALAREQRPVDRGVSFLDDAVRRQLLAGTNDEPVSDQKILGGDAPLHSPVVEDVRFLRAQLQQRLERRAGTSLGAGLEVAAGQNERRHHGGDLEIDLPRALAPAGDELERHAHARLADVEEEERHDRPPPRRERADRDERVHRRRAVLQVQPGGPVERPRAPEDDRRRQQEREPLPVVELQRLDHREQQHRQ